MKMIGAVLTAMMISGISLASTTQSGDQNSLKPIIIGSPAKTATKNVPARVSSIRIPKPKVFRSNPYRVSYFSTADDQDDIFIQDEDILPGYRRQDITKIRSNPTDDDPDGIITEEIRWKLFLARTAAMLRYRELHG